MKERVTGMVLSAATIGEYDKRVVLLTKERGAHLRLRQRGKAPQKSAVCCNGTVYLWGVFYL